VNGPDATREVSTIIENSDDKIEESHLSASFDDTCRAWNVCVSVGIYCFDLTDVSRNASEYPTCIVDAHSLYVSHLVSAIS
jgi:hypothetical protein